MKYYLKTIAGIALMTLIFGNPARADGKKDTITQARDKAIEWLKNQKVPNSVVPDPQPERRNLLLSYEIPENSPDYKYIYGRSIIYDDALAVIAFVMNKDYRNASLVLQALKRQQRKDGGIWFGYNVNNDWPSELDFSGSTDRTGATSWVGYASVYYLQQKVKESPDALSTKEARELLGFTKSIADYLLKLQVREENDLRYGLITGGRNSVVLKYENNAVIEVFQEGSIDWISAEHNIDAYYFLRDLGLLVKEIKYISAADNIKSGLLRIWSPVDRQYFRGIKPLFVDTALALDCASWGAVFSISAGKIEYARESIGAIESMYASYYTTPENITVNGYKPYAVKDIYEETDSKIIPFYFPDKKSTWKELNGVWVEGSLGVAMAYLKLGEREKVKSILEQMIALQNERGGFTYFTMDIPHEFSKHPSVASTAWFVIVATAYADKTALDGFWGK
ncbi:MAG: hypothetical protein EPN93_06895 [Spirochaetes bacterium]|nr:MAG: hypothetical protein EPN93_06895 [Spirochaetota bacterium]